MVLDACEKGNDNSQLCKQYEKNVSGLTNKGPCHTLTFMGGVRLISVQNCPYLNVTKVRRICWPRSTCPMGGASFRVPFPQIRKPRISARIGRSTHRYASPRLVGGRRMSPRFICNICFANRERQSAWVKCSALHRRSSLLM